MLFPTRLVAFFHATDDAVIKDCRVGYAKVFGKDCLSGVVSGRSAGEARWYGGCRQGSNPYNAAFTYSQNLGSKIIEGNGIR